LSETFQQKREKTAERLGLSSAAIPAHISIIMDGNGRWATGKGLSRFHGHRQGGKVVEEIAQYCVDIGIEYLTLYSFSMQNWKRPAEEVSFLMQLYKRYLEEIRPTLMEKNVKLAHLGRRDPLPDGVLEALDETIKQTGDNSGMILGLALNYGSRTEIADAAKSIANDYKEGRIKQLDDIDCDCFSNHLYTSEWPDPELLIRTSGELRVSNFLLWQISYAEFYVTEKYWPDFTPEDIDTAIIEYASRQRRLGDVQPQEKNF